MQTYSSLKGQSKSDDGITRIPEDTILERETVSDDGFDSFPKYSRPKTPGSESESISSHSRYETDSFHSCASEMADFEDAQSQAGAAAQGSSPPPPSVTESASVANAKEKEKEKEKDKKKKVKKRRRPKKKKGPSKENSTQIQDAPGRDSPGAGSPEPAGVQNRIGKSVPKAAPGGEVQLSTEELVGAMELLRLWKESVAAGREAEEKTWAWRLEYAIDTLRHLAEFIF